MTKSNQKSRKPGGSARQGARRGSVYEQIAKARARREEVLSGREGNSTDPAISGAIAAMRGKHAPDPQTHQSRTPPVSRMKPSAKGASKAEADRVASVRPSDPLMEASSQSERSLGDVVMAAAVEDAPTPGKGHLWLISLTLAALVVGSVAWFSRPASPPLADTAPAVTGLAKGPEGVDSATLSLTAPEVGETLEVALAASGRSGVSVVAPTAPSAPPRDEPMTAPNPRLLAPPAPRPATLVAEVPDAPPEDQSDTLAEDLNASERVSDVAGAGAAQSPDALAGPLESDGSEAGAVEADGTAMAEALPTASPEMIADAVADATQAAAPLPPADLSDIRVVLNAPRTVPDASLAAVISALEDSGADADPRRVNLTISTSNVRYYHAEDAEAAAAIADGIGARLRDFTDFQPTPPEGLVEIWMAGREVGTGGGSNDDGPLDQLAQDLRRLERGLRRALGGN